MQYEQSSFTAMSDCRTIQCQSDHVGVGGHVRERRGRFQSSTHVYESPYVRALYISTEYHRNQVRRKVSLNITVRIYRCFYLTMLFTIVIQTSSP